MSGRLADFIWLILSPRACVLKFKYRAISNGSGNPHLFLVSWKRRKPPRSPRRGRAMQTRAEEPIHARMAELRLTCEREIRIQRERASLAASSFRQSLLSIRSMAEETLANREKLGKLKDNLKELEADLEESLAVKTCKEAKHTVSAESLSTTVARTDQLTKLLLDQKTRRDEYAAVISQQLLALESLEEKSNQDIIERQDMEEAIMWYNKVLGFRAEGGEGVKFIFNKINSKNPDEEYSFTIRLENDVYK